MPRKCTRGAPWRCVTDSGRSGAVRRSRRVTGCATDPVIACRTASRAGEPLKGDNRHRGASRCYHTLPQYESQLVSNLDSNPIRVLCSVEMREIGPPLRAASAVERASTASIKTNSSHSGHKGGNPALVFSGDPGPLATPLSMSRGRLFGALSRLSLRLRAVDCGPPPRQ